MALQLFSRRVSSVLVPVVLIVGGCSGDAAVAPPPVTDVSRMYWALTLDHHAVTLSLVAPYDTIRLTATPRNAAGESLSELPAPTFTSTDLERVQVDADGLVHARKVGSQVKVVASLAYGNILHADTVVITVTNTATPPVLGSLSIDPADKTPADSAKIPVNTTKTLTAITKNTAGTTISGLAVYYASLDPTVATIDRSSGLITPHRVGRVTLIAAATAYGVTKVDTVPFTITHASQVPTQIALQPGANGQATWGFTVSRITITKGGVVLFINLPATNPTIDVMFDDPTNVAAASQFCVPPAITHGCGTGNIEAFGGNPAAAGPANNNRARSFPVPGTYQFYSTILGTGGTITVVDDDTL